MIDVYVDEYITFLKIEKGLSSASLSSYRQDLKHYTNYLQDNNITTLDNVDTEVLIQFIKFLTEKGLSAKTVSRTQSTLRNFHQFLLNQNIIEVNPAVRINPAVWLVK